MSLVTPPAPPTPGALPTLLEYIPSPTPDPPELGQSLRLRFDGSRRANTRAFCQKIRIKYGVDQSCTDPYALTCKTGTILPSVIPDADWNSSSPQAGLYLFKPKTPGGEVTNDCVFEIAGIEVSTVVGPATVTVTETSADHDASHCTEPNHDACFLDRVATFELPKFPADFGEVTFELNRSNVPPRGSVVLIWEGDKTGIYTLLQADAEVDAAKSSSYATDSRCRWTYTATGMIEDTTPTRSWPRARTRPSPASTTASCWSETPSSSSMSWVRR